MREHDGSKSAGDRDAIHLEELELRTRIGVSDGERADAQRLTVSLTLWPVAGFGALQDRIENAIDYAVVVREVQQLAANRTDRLLETLAGVMAAHLLTMFAIARVRVELRKFILPDVKHAAVIITRERRQQL